LSKRHWSACSKHPVLVSPGPALLRNHGDGPTLERAGPIFVHGTNQSRDGRSHKRQRRFLAAVLGIAGASRLDRIGRFNCLHTCYHGRGTRNISATRPRYQRNIKQRFPLLLKSRHLNRLLGPGQFRGSKLLFPRNVSFSQLFSNYMRMVFGQPCYEPFLKHCRAFGVSVPHHPTEPGVASHEKTR
jgi:hypothetical protein